MHGCIVNINLRSGVPIFFIRGGKVRLIQLLDYLSVASPESGLFSDRSRNKKVSHSCVLLTDRIEIHQLQPLVWPCNLFFVMLSGCDWWISIRSTKTVINASLESFVHKALKDEQIECINRIVCHGRDVLAVLPTGLGKSATYQLISKVAWNIYEIIHNSKVLFRMGRTANATSKNHLRTPCFFVGLQSERYLHQVLLLKLTHYERNRRTCFTK